MIQDQSVVCPIIIGRESDIQLMDRLAARSREGHGQVALISGEAGIGKSRLVQEVKAHAPGDMLFLEGFCFQTEITQPYAPLLDLYRNHVAAHAGEESASLLTSAANQLSQFLPELSDEPSDMNSTSLPDPRQAKQRIFQVLMQTFTKLAQIQPVIVIMEDLHWSDSNSLEFLLHLARRLSSLPILLVITYRAEETFPELTHFLAELDRGRISTELKLGHMSPVEVDAMLRATFELNEPISQEFLDVIFPLTEGNPFFIEEILKALIADGDIFYADGTWDRKAMDQLRIPRTIQAAVQRRTQKLDEQTLQALTLASVMGRRFDFRLLQQLLEANERDLIIMLKQLVQAQLVVEETADQFAFRHALTREAIYATLLLRERQGYHRQVGQVLEQLYANSLASHFADLSYHYYTGEIWPKALEYSQKAGDQASALYAQREAIVYYSRSLVAARQLNRTIEPRLLGARGHAYEILGDFKSALDDFEQTLRLAQEQQDGPAEWQTLIDLGFLWAGRDYQHTGEYFRRAAELAQRLGQSKLHAQSLNRWANWLVNIGQTADGLQAHHQALEIFEHSGDEQGMADTHDLLGMANLQHGDQVASYNEYQQAIPLFRKTNDKHGLISALVVASTTPYWDDTDLVPSQTPSESQRMGMEALELARQIGFSAGQAFAGWAIAIGLANRGIFGEAITYAKDALRIAMEIAHRQWNTAALYVLGHTYLLMLQADLAIQNLEQGLILARELGSAWWVGNITTDLANAYLLNEEPARSRALLDAVVQSEDQHLTRVKRRMLWAEANLLLMENQAAEALRIAEHLRLAKSAEGSGHQTQPIPMLLKLQGEARIALRQFEQAEQDLVQAKRGAEQREALPLLWQIHCLLGALYREQNQAENSETEFAHARQVLQILEANIQDEQLKANFMQDAQAALPKEKTPSKRQTEAERFGGLTPREREVARFLSQGKSNREIAEALVLSERTVENHVGNILTKLGFDSRAQVAVWAVEKGLGEKN